MPVRKQMQAAAYTFGGADWERFFRQYDKSGDGALELTQWSHKSEKLHAWLKEQGVKEQKAPEDMNHDHHGGGATRRRGPMRACAGPSAFFNAFHNFYDQRRD